jgi:amino acid permease
LADFDAVQYWRVRSRYCALGSVVCITFVLLLKATDVNGTIGFLAVPLVLFGLFCVAGLYCTHRHWRAFRDYEIASGGSAKTTQEKWHKVYPPGAG